LVEALDPLPGALEHAPGARTRAAIVLERARIHRDGGALVAAAEGGDAKLARDGDDPQHHLAFVELHGHHALAAARKLLHVLEREDEQPALA
jgi:hypothetical protein